MQRLRDRLGRIRVQPGFALIALIVLIGGLLWCAMQPWTANHFGYAVPGRDGLPAYVYENGRRYHSEQVCAGADWCASDRAKVGLPRCYTQSDLQSMQEWPLVQVDTMHALFADPHPILQRGGDLGLTAPYIVADGEDGEDGEDCYVVYSLEGGP